MLYGTATSVTFIRADEMLRRRRQSRLDNSREAEMIALTSVAFPSSTTSPSSR